MPLVQMDAQLLLVLEVKRIFFQAQGHLMFLYRNDRIPTHADNLAMYAPANFNGAAGKLINWSGAPQLDGAGGAYMFGDALIWTPTAGGAPNDIYGYYVVRSSDALLLYAERFSIAPVVVGADLTPFTVIPFFRETSIPV